MTADPRQMQPGVIVRVKINHNTVYASKRLQRAEALAVAEYLRGVLRANQGFVPLTKFPSADLEELSIRASLVMAVEVRCVNADGSLVGARETPPAPEPTS